MSKRTRRPSWPRLVLSDDQPEPRTRPEQSATLAYTNRKGRTFYLHGGRTKTGKQRYFMAKTVREGALSEMPDGYEFTESINAVVSVRRIESGRTLIHDEDVEVVRKEIARHKHLAGYRVDARGSAIIVYEPLGGLGTNFFDETERLFGDTRNRLAREALDLKRVRYEPVFRFERSPDGSYSASRMSYRGEGGWMPLNLGRLSELTKSYIRNLGTGQFFELL